MIWEGAGPQHLSLLLCWHFWQITISFGAPPLTWRLNLIAEEEKVSTAVMLHWWQFYLIVDKSGVGKNIWQPTNVRTEVIQSEDNFKWIQPREVNTQTFTSTRTVISGVAAETRWTKLKLRRERWGQRSRRKGWQRASLPPNHWQALEDRWGSYSWWTWQ